MTSTAQRSSSSRAKQSQPPSATGSNLANPGRTSFPSAPKPSSSTPNASEPNNMSAAVGGAPSHGHSDSVNGRPPTIPAIPSVNGTVAVPEHLRKASNAAPSGGSPAFTTNGGAQTGAQNKIQFGSLPTGNNNASPAMGTPHQNTANLSVNQLNPRVPSPSNSPSPIPQPASVSGGRPPSTFQGQGNGLSFGQMPGDPNDPTVSSTHFPRRATRADLY